VFELDPYSDVLREGDIGQKELKLHMKVHEKLLYTRKCILIHGHYINRQSPHVRKLNHLIELVNRPEDINL
jgi:hypothetical protein